MPPCQAYSYGALAWSMCYARATSGAKPIVVTETGYGTNGKVHGQVPYAVQAKYTGRTLLTMFNAGVQRTFIYEMIDMDSGYWGLLFNTLAPKASYHEVSTLLRLADEPAPAGELRAIELALSGSTANVRRTLLQKADGTFLLALWIERSSFDVDANGPNGAGKVITVPPQAVQVRLPVSVATVMAHRLGDNGKATVTSPAGTRDDSGSTFALQVTDNITVLVFRAD